MNIVKKVYCILRHIGPRLVWLRLGVYAQKRLGITRRLFAPRPWNTIRLSDMLTPGVPTEPDGYAAYKCANPPTFLFPLGEPPVIPPELRPVSSRRHPSLDDRLALLEQDRCVYFGHTPSTEAIDWHKNPFDGSRCCADRTWCDIPDHLPATGDQRIMWEPSRATWAIDMARAAPHGFDLDSAALYWRWVDSWMVANPPFMGYQWKCGQESAVRFISLALGFWSVSTPAGTAPARWEQFARLAWATGYRIERFIQYAISQKSNHAIAEACGLILISQLFPEFRAASRWRALGRKVMEQELLRTVYADGSYIQQSFNYQRMTLQEATLAARLLELAGEPLRPDVCELLGRNAEFLFQMMDPETGRVPQYGNNDGAWVLPLSESEFWDFRPVIQSTYYLAHRRRRLGAGPWDENLLWLFGASAVKTPVTEAPPSQSSSFDVGGYYTLRRRDTWAMTRCHSYIDRPYHCDPSHVDLWWRGQNILRDCGTYLYYLPDRVDMETYFHSIRAHNSIEIDRSEPLEQVSRYLKFPWPKSMVRDFRPHGECPVLECDFYGYDRPPWRVVCRRTLLSLDDTAWVIVDDVLGDGRHRATLRWHFPDVPCVVDAADYAVRLTLGQGEEAFARVAAWGGAPQRFEVVRGRDARDAVQGFASTHYGQCDPIPVLEAEFEAALPLRIVTLLTLGVEGAVRHLAASPPDSQQWEITAGPRRWLVRLAPPARSVRNNLLGVDTRD